jgi:hypothetical protein
MTCPACDRAQVNPMCGLFAANCDGCETRAVALAPKAIRKNAYEQKPDADRAAFIAAVAAEYERIQAVRANKDKT